MAEKQKYLDNAEFYGELLKWRDSHRDPMQRTPSERLGELLILLHDRIMGSGKFRGYRQDLKDEMKSFSIYRILKCGLKSYDFSKKNPFGYFTRAVQLNYIQVLKQYYNRLNRHQEFVKNELAKVDTQGNGRLEALLNRFGVSGAP